jgi:hypothetical protein
MALAGRLELLNAEAEKLVSGYQALGLSRVFAALYGMTKQ